MDLAQHDDGALVVEELLPGSERLLEVQEKIYDRPRERPSAAGSPNDFLDHLRPN